MSARIAEDGLVKAISEGRRVGSSLRNQPSGEEQWRLAYHEISPEASEYRYSVSAKQFGEHLVALSSASRPIRDRAIPQITFDDGHRSIFDYAFPLLQKSALKATFFVVTAFVDSNDQCVSWDQLRELVSAGHQVQSHGWSHRLLTRCSRRELEIELIKSKREIEDRLGVEITALSAPGGRFDKSVIATCRKAGYSELYHSNPWIPDRTIHDVRLKGRVMVTNGMDGSALCSHTQASRIRKLYFRARYAGKSKLRTLLGDEVYHKLWCSLANWKPGSGIELRVDHPKKATEQPYKT
jgi:peptidoglycan/xylan/chitin deacetylase (PgdA/CDA1 family)